MRSEAWDDDEREFEKKHGFAKREEHDHKFTDGKCVICGKTREELRREW